MFRRVALIGIAVAAGLIVLLLVTSGRRQSPTVPPPAPPPPSASGSSEVLVGWDLPLSDVETGERIGLISAKEAVVQKDRTVDVSDPVITLTRQPDRPVTITAPAGTVNIEEKSAVLRASATRRVRVQATGSQQPMTVEADEVHWNSALKQVTTAGPVSMTLGRAEIMGRNLRSEAEMTHFVLPEDVQVVLANSTGGLLGPPGRSDGAVRVTCVGELHFDRSENLATFHDDVRLTEGRRWPRTGAVRLASRIRRSISGYIVLTTSTTGESSAPS